MIGFYFDIPFASEALQAGDDAGPVRKVQEFTRHSRHKGPPVPRQGVGGCRTKGDKDDSQDGLHANTTPNFEATKTGDRSGREGGHL